MSYLSYISDKELLAAVKEVFLIGHNKHKGAEKTFHKNVIDPFTTQFESASFELDHNEWYKAELARQSQKTLTNAVGNLHQKILGCVKDWEDVKTGSIIDLKCDKQKIVAEVKNKFNTVSFGKLADQYNKLKGQVMPKNSIYNGYTAYYVNIIPKKPERFDTTFTPSDPDNGKPCETNEKIRVIDGASFYTLVTGEQDALKDLFYILPKVLEDIIMATFTDVGKNFKLPDQGKFREYFDKAYGK